MIEFLQSTRVIDSVEPKAAAALCYQRRLLDGAAQAYRMHGLAAVFLKRHGRYRINPRGDKSGIQTDFCPPREMLAFTPARSGEMEGPGWFADALPRVISVLQKRTTAGEVSRNLSD